MPDSAQRAEQIADLQQRVHTASELVSLLERVCRLHAALEEGVVHKIEIASSQVGCVTFDGVVHVGHELLARRVRDAVRDAIASFADETRAELSQCVRPISNPGEAAEEGGVVVDG